MGKKNLDKLFQEKLSNFSDAPDEKVWQSINASLDEKKKSRKVIPIWWKLGGVAALLLIGIFLINPFEDNNISFDAATTESEKQKDKNTTIDKEVKTKELFEKPDTEIVDKNLPFKEGIAAQETESDVIKETTEEDVVKKSKFNTAVKEERLRVAESANSKSRGKVQNNRNDQQPILEKSDITKNAEVAVATTQNSREKRHSIEENASGSITDEEVARKTNPSPIEETAMAQVDKTETPKKGSDSVKKKSIFDEIAEQEQKNEVVAENKGGKWSAGPSVAPVYFDALGEGSPVHSIFVPNSKSGDLNLSYGLSVAYEINEKFKIRSGVHRVDYGYSTNDVEFSSSLESSAIGQIANVNYSATAKNIVVASNASDNNVQNMENIVPIAEDFSGQGLSQNGSMTQQFGYLEVPVELEYALVDKKFGVNLIGGVSSLFLVDNSISLSSGNLTTEMGEANNVNDVNFSTNVGIGLNYKFTPKVQLNVEPVFKYQLNTFSQTDGTFQPFTVGVYSGISFKF